jgi:hypothetical protein
MKEEIQDPEKLKRKYRLCFLFNELEFEAFKKHCKKYKITNKAKYMREVVIANILQKQEEDHPTLFTNNDMQKMERPKNCKPDATVQELF